MNKYVGVDTNVLIYLQNKNSPYFKYATSFMNKVYDQVICPVISSQNITEFISVMTNQKAIGKKIPVTEVLEIVNEMRDSGYFRIIYPDSKVLDTFLKLAIKFSLLGALNHDMFLASTFISNKINTIITEDSKVFEKCGMKTTSLYNIV